MTEPTKAQREEVQRWYKTHVHRLLYPPTEAEKRCAAAIVSAVATLARAKEKERDG